MAIPMSHDWYYSAYGPVYPTYPYRAVPIEAHVKWIMTNEQLNRLNTLAREIALQNDLVLSTHTDIGSFSINLFEKDEEEIAVADE